MGVGRGRPPALRPWLELRRTGQRFRGILPHMSRGDSTHQATRRLPSEQGGCSSEAFKGPLASNLGVGGSHLTYPAKLEFGDVSTGLNR